jgi:hypothetical protein
MFFAERSKLIISKTYQMIFFEWGNDALKIYADAIAHGRKEAP